METLPDVLLSCIFSFQSLPDLIRVCSRVNRNFLRCSKKLGSHCRFLSLDGFPNNLDVHSFLRRLMSIPIVSFRCHRHMHPNEIGSILPVWQLEKVYLGQKRGISHCIDSLPLSVTRLEIVDGRYARLGSLNRFHQLKELSIMSDFGEWGGDDMDAFKRLLVKFVSFELLDFDEPEKRKIQAIFSWGQLQGLEIVWRTFGLGREELNPEELSTEQTFAKFLKLELLQVSSSLKCLILQGFANVEGEIQETIQNNRTIFPSLVLLVFMNDQGQRRDIVLKD